eukprot:TRINITY_DN47936_c0_g1_i1.p1 TRINITY_DN47936_c0_g1~~TRINITY_DN47936_c0_g1_i1.p1  ORF type:complete len:295 (+),score=30.48 TRINITY_DN47936_c0_g1_i1:69-953(+)
MAPEIWECKGATEKSDVYALGIVFWELLNTCMSGQYSIPYAEYNFKTEFAMSNQIIRNGKRPTLPEGTPGSFAQLVTCAWDSNANLRPTASSLLRMCSPCRVEWETNNGRWEKLRKLAFVTGNQQKALAKHQNFKFTIILIEAVDFTESNLKEDKAPTIQFDVASSEFTAKKPKLEERYKSGDIDSSQAVETTTQVWSWGEEVFNFSATNCSHETILTMKVSNPISKDLGEAEIHLSKYFEDSHLGALHDEYIPLCRREKVTSTDNLLSDRKPEFFFKPTTGSIHLQIKAENSD